MSEPTTRVALFGKRILISVSLATLGCFAVISGCVSTSTPSNVSNICEVFDEKRSWLRSAARAERRWRIPIPVMMAIIHKESSFRATVRPSREKILGLIPWKRPTTSLGYSQAKDETWWDYIEATKNRTASRTNFADSIDFVGWYLSRSVAHAGIAPTNAAHLYVSYYAGLSGYKSGKWKSSKWIVDASNRVQKQANAYDAQLKRCRAGRSRVRN